MNDVKIKDPYLVPREKIGKNTDHAHLLEVSGLCPLCGKYLLKPKGNSKNKLYQIAHIYPNSPTEHQSSELIGLERLGNTCEDFENKIALCKDCHGSYDDDVTKTEYLLLLELKKRLLNQAKSKENTSTQDLEDNIVLVIDALSSFHPGDITTLQYKGVQIKDKIEDEYFLLKYKIEMYNTNYYYFIKETFKNLVEEKQLNFNVIASQIRTSYLKSAEVIDNKSDVFDGLVKWMQSKVTGAKIETCEVVIAFFIQNCEVFDEISK